MEGGDDGMRNNWDQGSWQRVDIEGWTKAKMWWWSSCMVVGLFKNFKMVHHLPCLATC
jgi:hypothetical protein